MVKCFFSKWHVEVNFLTCQLNKPTRSVDVLMRVAEGMKVINVSFAEISEVWPDSSKDFVTFERGSLKIHIRVLTIQLNRRE